MYTNKNNVTLSPDVTYIRNIKDSTKESFIISLIKILPNSSTKYTFSLNIEHLSGEFYSDMEEIDSSYSLYRDGKAVYEKKIGVNDTLNIKLNAEQNSTYNLVFYYEKEDNIIILPSQANCLLLLFDRNEENNFIINPKYNKENFIIFLSTLTSSISVVKSGNKLQFNEKRKFIQDFYEENDKYIVKVYDNAFFSLYYYLVSIFKFDNKEKYINYGILQESVPYPILFEESKCKQANYMYLFDYLNGNLKVNFTLFDDTKFEVKIIINEKTYNQNYIISKNYTKFELSEDFIKTYYVKDQPYKINFIIKPKNENSSILEIAINPKEDSIPYNPGKSSIAKLFESEIFIITLVIIVVLIMIIIIISSILYRTRKSYKNLKDQINTTSFKDGGIDRDDKDELLD